MESGEKTEVIGLEPCASHCTETQEKSIREGDEVFAICSVEDSGNYQWKDNTDKDKGSVS